MKHALKSTVFFGLGCAAIAAFAQTGDGAARPQFQEDGSVLVPSFELPPSVFSSEGAQALQRLRAKNAGISSSTLPREIGATRKAMTTMLAPRVDLIRSMYPAKAEETSMAGIPVRIVTPADGDFDRDRVLLNLHGGAFAHCWESCSLLESIPISAMGDFKVISVNYRMAPEYKHPAAIEDAAKVYAELLNHHEPEHIGIYGCSAGGALTAQMAAWLPAHGLPQAGAVGIFGAGGVRFRAGDSAYIAGNVDGALPAPAKDGTPPPDITFGYFDDADMKAADVSPALYQNVMKTYPPTMLITGTRAFDLSPAIYTNSMLMKAGVETDLIVGEAMDHCYILTPSLPESQDAYAAIVSFFKKHLK